ncbi:MAG: B12-binding domain-containing radical SAM protein [Spirochaetia bacterium]|nr:B12-binding domain-containing radical SAM protein [Spirochaetia bacterium]
MKILMVSPEYPATFWSFKHALPFVGKKASIPPLGLLTISAMLPAYWEKRLVDMNAGPLQDSDIQWADCVFVSAMIVQKKSAQDVLNRAKLFGKYTVAGGPVFTTGYKDFYNADTFVLNEGEPSIAGLVEGLTNGTARHIYNTDEKPDITKTPVPDWGILDRRKYASMAMQISRGCPFDCEFCDIIVMNGRVPRVKTPQQVINEMDALYEYGWRGSLFIVDDNFIGNKVKVKEILKAIGVWMRAKNRPFTLYTEASINLADDAKLMKLMQEANFNSVFVGIETPSEEALLSCGKVQNAGKDLSEKVRILQRNGLQVQAGFILGFDTDTPKIFDEMIKFIQKSGIVTAMVGLLNALPETKLYKRLQESGRLLKMPTGGNNTDFSVNFMPKMDPGILVDGYKKVLNSIFSAKNFYDRVITFLKEYNATASETKLNAGIKLKAFARAIWKLGIIDRGRLYFWRLLAWTAIKKPKFLPEAIALSIYGFHFRTVLTSNTQAA